MPLALALAGLVRAALTRDHAVALAAVDHATMLCNNSALVLGFDALTRCICGDCGKAILHAEKAMRLSPWEPLVFHAALALALACLLTGREADAVAFARKAIDGNANVAFAHCALAIALARLDRIEEAAQAVNRLLAVAPSFRIGALRRIRFSYAKRLQADFNLLRAAHVPE